MGSGSNRLGILAVVVGLTLCLEVPAVGAPADSVLPATDLGAMEEEVRLQLEAARSRVLTLADSADDEAQSELAASYGALGQLYFLYSLDEAATHTFRAARELSPGDARWAYYLGVLGQDRRRLDSAHIHLIEALDLGAPPLPILVRLGRVELARNRPTEAQAWFERALELGPGSAAALAGLGQAERQAGRTRQAIDHLEAALAIQPAASSLHYQLGLAFRDLGDMESARGHLELQGRQRTLFSDPLVDSLGQLARGAHFQLFYGTQSSLLGDLDGAIDRYRSALDADPDNVMARQALATALMKQQSPAAEEELRRLLISDPDNVEGHLRLGGTLVARGANEEALPLLERATELAPDYADAHLGLAMALAGVGRLTDAESELARALELDPFDRLVLKQRARLFTSLERYDEARADLETALAIEDEDPEVQLGLGILASRQNLTDEALGHYRAALELGGDPQSLGWAHLEIGNILAARGANPEAISHLTQAAAVMPDFTALQSNLAGLLGREGRFAEAAVAFARVVELEPSAEQAHFGRAIARLMAGEEAQARTDLEQSTTSLPRSLALRHALARLLATSRVAEVRDGARALEMAEAIFREQQTPEHAETLAMAYAELGRFDEAVLWQSRILERAGATGPTEQIDRLRRRLADYERGLPCRAPWREGG